MLGPMLVAAQRRMGMAGQSSGRYGFAGVGACFCCGCLGRLWVEIIETDVIGQCH